MISAKNLAMALVAGLFVAASGTVWGHGKDHKIGSSEHQDIKARHELMENILFATKVAGQMVKRETAYDPVKAELAIRMMKSTA